jgi:RHS repeat-associated protein
VGYDLAGRLTSVVGAVSRGRPRICTTRTYSFDTESNRTALTSYRTYALDPARLLRSRTEGSSTSTNHYGSASGDSPAWIALPSSAWSRNIVGIGGDLAAIQDNNGTVTLQLTNLHGDTVATLDDTTTATSIASYTESTEFGTPYFPSTAYARYGWLGAKQRSRDTLGGLTLMGVRLYNPNTGRFLQTDPIPGGSANPYDYTNQDPYNNVDLDGRWCAFGKNPNGSCRGSRQARAVGRGINRYKVDIALTAVGFLPGVGEAVWAYRAYQAYRVVRVGRMAATARRVTTAYRAVAGNRFVTGCTTAASISLANSANWHNATSRLATAAVSCISQMWKVR